VVLPALPNLHAGHGLLLGGDWTGFHAMGEELALQMALDGWGAWELRHIGNAPSGMLAALYFVFGIHEPWLFLPINALLFGAATFMLHKIFKLVVTTRHSFFAILPFMMFPSALMIYGQVHKDIFSITGTFFIIFVWADLAGRTTLTWRKMLLRIATILTGLALVWIVRPYLLEPMLLVGFFAALLLSARVGRRGYRSWWCALAIFLSIQLVAMNYASPRLLAPPKEVKESKLLSAASKEVKESKLLSAPRNRLDRISLKMGEVRRGFASNLLAGSNIDTEVRFASIEDVLLYIPRALQIGLLAPFPSMWRGQAVNKGGGTMRVLSGIEMMFTYVFLVGFLGLLAYGKERWATLLVAAGMALALTLILTLVIPNVGTLYRMRYANCALLNGLGILGWGLWFQARSQMKYE
jgi:hypothetical protein